MTVYDVLCIVRYESETGTTDFETLPYTDSSNPLTIVRGDSVKFTVVQGSQASGYSFIIHGIEPSIWTSSSNSPTLSPGQSFTVASSPSAVVGASGYTDYIGVDCYAGNGDSIYSGVFVKVTDGADIVPDNFELGPGAIDIPPSSVATSMAVRVLGINQGILATTSNGGYFTVNNGAPTSSTTVYNMDLIQVYMTAASTYSTTVSTTLNIGGVTDTFSVTTVANPGTGIIIDFPVTSGVIKLTDVINFFKGPNNMRGYFRGGTYVPDIPKNSGIPTSGTLNLRQFLGSGTAFMFTKLPATQLRSIDTVGAGSKTATATWTVGGPNSYDFDIGFGPGIKNNLEYRFELNELDVPPPEGASIGVFMSSPSGNPTGYSTANTSVTISKTVPSNAEGLFYGEVIIYARSIYPPYPIINTRVQYYFSFYGP